MVKTAAYFPLQCSLNSVPVMGAVLSSLQSAGIGTQENSMTSDCAVIWSVLWAGRLAPNRAVYEHYRAEGRPVIIIEIGALHRGHTWKVCVNNVTAAGYYGHTTNLDWDRPQKLGILLSAPAKTQSHVVVALQHAHSLQVADLSSMTQWVVDTVHQVRQHTDRKIVVRPHPRSRILLPHLPPDVEINTPRKLANTYDSFDFDTRCHAVINYNSGPGIQAAIAGTRPAVDASSLAAPVGISLSNIEQPYNVDRSQWLTEIAHTEYTLEELQQGLWLKRIAQELQAL